MSSVIFEMFSGLIDDIMQKSGVIFEIFDRLVGEPQNGQRKEYLSLFK